MWDRYLTKIFDSSLRCLFLRAAEREKNWTKILISLLSTIFFFVETIGLSEGKRVGKPLDGQHLLAPGLDQEKVSVNLVGNIKREDRFTKLVIFDID